MTTLITPALSPTNLMGFSNRETSKAQKTNINLNEVTKKTLASCALTFSNTLLSATVFISKATGPTIILPLAIGHSTKQLHKWNTTFAKHAYTPFKIWAEKLSAENHAMIVTHKVIDIVDRQVMFSPENYKKQSMTLIRAVFAPISLVLSLSAIAVAAAAKPFWLLFFVPGIVTDLVASGVTCANYGISQLTYTPLQNLALKIHTTQLLMFAECMKCMNNSGGF